MGIILQVSNRSNDIYVWGNLIWGNKTTFPPEHEMYLYFSLYMYIYLYMCKFSVTLINWRFFRLLSYGPLRGYSKKMNMFASHSHLGLETKCTRL